MRPTLALPRYTGRRLAILVVALAVALVAAPTGGKVVAQGPLTLTERTDAANAPPSAPPATVRSQGLDPPAQVSGVQASARSDTKISVSWSAAAKADGYLVQWATRRAVL